MADNTTLNTGTGGDVIATDDISGVKYPRSKITLGADGSNDGDVSSSNPMPVSVAVGATTIAKAEDAAHSSGDVGVMALSVRKDTAAATAGADGDYQPVITDANGRLHVNVGNTVSAQQSGTWTIDSISSAVDVVVAAAAGSIAKNEDQASSNGDCGTAMLAVRKATPANTSGTDGDYEFLQMSAGRLWASVIVDSALPAGTNAIGKLAANDGVDIGDVTINNASGGSAVNIQDGSNSITVDAPVATPVFVRLSDGASAISTLPVSAASLPLPTGAATDTGLASIDSRLAGTLTVTGTVGISNTVSAAQSGTWNVATVSTITNVVHVDDNSGSLTVDAPVGTPVYVRLSDGASAISTLPVSLASVPSHNVTNAGTFAVQATVAAGASTIAKAEDAASADADVGVPAMAVRKATPANTSGTDGDYEMLQMSAGRLWASATIDAALPAGTNAIGKLAANDGVDIGDVTINNTSLTVAAPVGTPAFVRLSDGASAISTLPVSLASVPSHAVTNAGTFAVQATVAAGAATIAKAEDAASADADVGVPAMAVRKATPANTSGTDGDYEMLQMSAGRLWASATIDAALPAGTATIGAVGLVPKTSGGLSFYKNINLQNSDVSVKASAGQVYWIFAINLGSTPRYLKFYNAATASVTVGSTAPDLTIPIPSHGDTNGAGVQINIPMGLAFGTAITIAATTGIGDSDSGNPGANEVVVAIGYA